MATPIENAIQRLAILREEIAQIERFIALYAVFSEPTTPSSPPSHPAHSRETFPQSDPVVDCGDNYRRGKRDSPRPKELAEMMERLIREVGRPMTRGEIVDAFAKRDIEIPAKDPARYLGTIAWRNKRIFVNIEGRGYWLRDSPAGVKGIPPNTPYSDPPEETDPDLDPDSDANLFG